MYKKTQKCVLLTQKFVSYFFFFNYIHSRNDRPLIISHHSTLSSSVLHSPHTPQLYRFYRNRWKSTVDERHQLIRWQFMFAPRQTTRHYSHLTTPKSNSVTCLKLSQLLDEFTSDHTKYIYSRVVINFTLIGQI